MWQYIAVWVATTVLSSLLAPKPRVQDAQPAQIEGKDVPIAKEGAPIPVVFGTRFVSAPNVVWWGDVVVKPIRRSASSGGKKG